jgi:hypothetical protein
MTYLEDILNERDVHPAARKLMTDASAILWEIDVGPLGSDPGHDAYVEFTSWRDEHPDAELDACMEWIESSFGATYEPGVAGEEAIADLLARDDDDEIDFHQDVYVLDETVIATALGQLLHEGRIDESGRPTIRLAIQRQLHPLVLERVFVEDVRETRTSALREVARLVDAAPAR